MPTNTTNANAPADCHHSAQVSGRTDFPCSMRFRMSTGLAMARKSSTAVLLALLLVLQGAPLFGQGTVMPAPKFFATDQNGLPCSGCLLSTFAAGTTTPQATYTDSTLVTPNANPVVLDSSGRATVFLGALSFKFVLKTSAGSTLWTVDNVASIGLSTAAVGSELVVFAGDPNVPIVATSYPVGTTFDKLHGGTLIWNFNSANVVGTYALEGMLIGNGGTVTAALVNLSDGSPETALVTIASTSTTGERQQSSAVTFAASGAAKSYAIKVKVSAGYGLAWSLRLVRIS